LTNSSQFTGIRHAALLDELVKIAEEGGQSQSGGIGKALRAIGVGAAGSAAGYGAAELLARNMKFFNQAQGSSVGAANATLDRRVRTARIILPILSGAAVTLADRYRHRLSREFSQVRGYEDKK